jgi:hypothetical protein
MLKAQHSHQSTQIRLSVAPQTPQPLIEFPRSLPSSNSSQ